VPTHKETSRLSSAAQRNSVFAMARVRTEASARRPALKRALNKPGKDVQADPGDFVQGEERDGERSSIVRERSRIFWKRGWLLRLATVPTAEAMALLAPSRAR
jgi:hypothetical protein